MPVWPEGTRMMTLPVDDRTSKYESSLRRAANTELLRRGAACRGPVKGPFPAGFVPSSASHVAGAGDRGAVPRRQVTLVHLGDVGVRLVL